MFSSYSNVQIDIEVPRDTNQDGVRVSLTLKTIKLFDGEHWGHKRIHLTHNTKQPGKRYN